MHWTRRRVRNWAATKSLAPRAAVPITRKELNSRPAFEKSGARSAHLRSQRSCVSGAEPIQDWACTEEPRLLRTCRRNQKDFSRRRFGLENKQKIKKSTADSRKRAHVAEAEATTAAAWSGGGGSSVCSNSSSCSRKTIHCAAAPSRASARNKGSNWFFAAAAVSVGEGGRDTSSPAAVRAWFHSAGRTASSSSPSKRGGEENRKQPAERRSEGGSKPPLPSMVRGYLRTEDTLPVARRSTCFARLRQASPSGAGHACFQRAFLLGVLVIRPLYCGDAIVVLDSRIRGASARSCGYPTRSV